jgi:hypothetical protein
MKSPYSVSFARLKLVLGRCLHKLKLVRRIKAGHMLLATARLGSQVSPSLDARYDPSNRATARPLAG